MTFGKNLKKFRESLGLTMREFAESMKLSPNLIYLYENEKSYPKINTLELICETYGVEPNLLLGYDCKYDLSDAQIQLDGISEQLGTLCDTLEYAQKKLNKLKGGE